MQVKIRAAAMRLLYAGKRLSFPRTLCDGILGGFASGFDLARTLFLSSESHRVCGAEGGGTRQVAQGRE